MKNLLLQMAVTMTISCGMFFVILTGGIDLSVGSIVGVSGVLVAGLMPALGWFLASVVAILVGLVLGHHQRGAGIEAENSALHRHARHDVFRPAASLTGITNASTILWTKFDNVSTFKQLGGGRLWGAIPIPAIVWLVVFIITIILVMRTKFGRVSYAIGGNEEATRLSGINTLFYKILPYTYCGLLAGLGGVILTARLGVGSPASGTGQEMDCITAVVIGGTLLTGRHKAISRAC